MPGTHHLFALTRLLLRLATLFALFLIAVLSLTLAGQGCNIEVALVDTEGETAIDVFYLTKNGAKLEKDEERVLREALMQAMEENAR